MKNDSEDDILKDLALIEYFINYQTSTTLIEELTGLDFPEVCFEKNPLFFFENDYTTANRIALPYTYSRMPSPYCPTDPLGALAYPGKECSKILEFSISGKLEPLGQFNISHNICLKT